jgi:FkbM family methyltransferase
MTRVRAIARSVLEKLVSRVRFNDSWLYGMYLSVFRPTYSRRRRAEHRFYQRLLWQVGAKLVFDIGANGGGKTAVFSSIVDTVVSVEPSPAAVKILADRFLYNRRVVVVGQGVGAEEGSAKFYLFGEADCYNTFSPKWLESLAGSGLSDRPHKMPKAVLEVPVTTLDRLMGEHGVPSYIKIDVEGYELPVIKGLSKPIPLVSFECNLPEFAAETIECLSRLAELSPSALFNYCVEEPPVRFVSEQWLRRDQMCQIVRGGDRRFMEIYCKSI